MEKEQTNQDQEKIDKIRKEQEDILKEIEKNDENWREATERVKIINDIEKLRADNVKQELAKKEEELREKYDSAPVEEEPKKLELDKVQNPEIKDFILNLNLERIMPPEFASMNEAQQLKVVRDLERRLVDVTKSGAQTQYSEELKEKFANLTGSKVAIALKKISLNMGGIFDKESKTRSFEKETLQKLTHSEEGREFVAQNLNLLVDNTKNKEVVIDFNTPCTVYLKNNEEEEEELKNWTREEKIAIERFNSAANQFHNKPYEWGQGKGKNKEAYEEAREKYESVKKEILIIKSRKESEQDKGKTMLELMQVDNIIKMEQVLNTHPEAQMELAKIMKDGKTKGYLQDSINVLNKLTGGNWVNRALIAGGYGARLGTKVLAGVTATSATVAGTMTLLAAPIIGGAFGAIRGKFEGEKTIKKKKIESRYGAEEKVKGIRNATKATHLTEQLEKLIDNIEGSTNNKDKEHALNLLRTRVAHTMGKREIGQVNFGDGNSILSNQLDLTNTLNKAMVLVEANSEKINTEMEDRIKKLLTKQSEKTEGKTAEAKKEFVKEQIMRGAKYGAMFATGGYVLRLVGEELGWWGVSEENQTQKVYGPQKEFGARDMINQNKIAQPIDNTKYDLKIDKNIDESSLKFSEIKVAELVETESIEGENFIKRATKWIQGLDFEKLKWSRFGAGGQEGVSVPGDSTLMEDSPTQAPQGPFQISHDENFADAVSQAHGALESVTPQGGEVYQAVERGDGLSQTLEKMLKAGTVPEAFKKLMGDNPTANDWGRLMNKIGAWDPENGTKIPVYQGDEVGFDKEGNIVLNRGGENIVLAEIKEDGTYVGSDWTDKINEEMLEKETIIKTETASESDTVKDLHKTQTIPDGIIKFEEVKSTDPLENNMEKPADYLHKRQTVPEQVAKYSAVENEGGKIETIENEKSLQMLNKEYEDNVKYFFGKNMAVWESIREKPAGGVMAMDIKTVRPELRLVLGYFQNLQEETGLKPIAGTITTPAETVSQYLRRTLTWAMENGRLDELKAENFTLPSLEEVYDDEPYDPSKR